MGHTELDTVKMLFLYHSSFCYVILFKYLQIMSVLEINKDLNVVILDHKHFLERVYGGLKVFDQLLDSFKVKTPFRMDLEAEKVAANLENGNKHQHESNKRKRKRKLSENDFNPEVLEVKKKYDHSKNLIESHFNGTPSIDEIRENNKVLRVEVKKYMERLQTFEIPLKGQNFSNECVKKDGIVYPPNCEFFNIDISQLHQLEGKGKFDVVVMDPPWLNKHVKRVKSGAGGYSMVEDSALEAVDLRPLLSAEAVVAVWCTNSARRRAAVAAMFRSWGLELAATWTWLKVTQHGELVADFSVSGAKQPHEVVLVAARSALAVPPLLLVSVPSALHSHKPPLADTLRWVLGREREADTGTWDKLNKLEIFGRNLLPGWTTVGNQPCLFNIDVD